MTRFAVLVVCVLAVLGRPTRAEDDYPDPEITAAERDHWSFQPVQQTVAPGVTGSKRYVRNDIDRFVLAKLVEKRLKPAPQADPLTLLRRATLDLTGLPPTPADVADFLADTRPDAYEKLVDRLLASPHYGERWAGHWLDVVRFAESNGYEMDADRPHAWGYRDYVIRSLNADKPYDVFLTEQIAGDELAAGKDPRQAADLWAATGLHRCGPIHQVSGNTDAVVLRQEMLTEMVNGLSSAVLGLTVGCARCHDHKFDPVSAGDYYRLQAFFGGVKYTDVDLATADQKAARAERMKELNAKIGPLREKVAALDAPVKAKLVAAKRAALEPKYRDALDVAADKRTAEQKKLVGEANTLLQVRWDEILDAMPPADLAVRSRLRDQIHALDAQTPPPDPAAWAVKAGEPAKTHVAKRGDPRKKGPAVGPAVPRVLVSAEVEVKTRTDLAKWLTRPDHPLTARVIVNRLWQHHFGRGIVGTPNDFGVRGDRPTHPELLDWLATELTGNGWSLKHVHRLIVTSATYRQAAGLPPKADAENKLLSVMRPRRLEAESLRDSILAAAGTLNPKAGGPSVKVPLEPEVYDLIFTEGEPDGLWPVTPDPAEHARRSVYLFNKRNVRLPLLEAFDQPDTLNSCAARPVSTFAPQALILMNGPFVHEQGKALAARLLKEHFGDPDKQVEALYRRTVGRKPTDADAKLAAAFLEGQWKVIAAGPRPKVFGIELPHDDHAVRVRALADLCVVLFNTTEFVTIP